MSDKQIYDIEEFTFKRKFSINPYKKLRLPLGEMDCYKDWINTRRGAPYPVTSTNETEVCSLSESLPDAHYSVTNETETLLYKARLLGQHFPYATYEITIDDMRFSDEKSCIGILIQSPKLPRAVIALHNNADGLYALCDVESADPKPCEERRISADIKWRAGLSFIVTCRGRSFDIYLRPDRKPEYIGTFTLPEYNDVIIYDVFNSTTASLYVGLQNGDSVTCDTCFYLEGGISHADMKCMRYENGQPIIEHGRLFMTLSSRLQAAGFQSVVSWNPSTSDIRMEGAIFFDVGDGKWCQDVATSAVYDRRTGEWYVWACSFSHGHVLCHGRSYADLRYGINVLDVELMPFEQSVKGEADSLGAEDTDGEIERAVVSDDRLFYAKFGDEDPDLMFDETRGKWLLGICRLTDEAGESRQHYHYFLYESDDPFTGYKYVDNVVKGDNTGGSIIRVAGKLYLLCGSDFGVRAQYHLHPIDDLSQYTLLKFDFDDGGFRGWGTVIPVPCGVRTKYMMMTFDRHNGSDYNWSYGNIYVFEADKMNPALAQ